MNRRLLVIPVAVAAALGLCAGTVSANAFTADATCAGFTVDMPRTEDGTQVRTYRNGVLVRTDDVTVFGTPVRFTLVSPDQSVAQVWRVEIDSRWNTDQVFTEFVAPCVATSVPSSTVTPTTAPPSPSTTVPETTVVAVTTPPVVPSTTVVNPPRTTTTTPTTTAGVPPVFELPATGRPVGGQVAAGSLLLGAGAVALVAARRRAVRS
jgi:hypothetical protein